MARHAILIKVVVQTVWAEVDTESGMAVEHVDPQTIVPADEWAGFYEKWAGDWNTVRHLVSDSDVDREKAATNGH
jgi:hypothetical protein